MLLPNPPGLEVWFGIAPEGTQMPYVVMKQDFLQPMFLQGGTANIEPVNIIFNLYATSAQDAETYGEQLAAFYDFLKFTAPDGDYVMTMMRQSQGMWLMRQGKGLNNKDVWLYEVQYTAVIGHNPPGA